MAHRRMPCAAHSSSAAKYVAREGSKGAPVRGSVPEPLRHTDRAHEVLASLLVVLQHRVAAKLNSSMHWIGSD